MKRDSGIADLRGGYIREQHSEKDVLARMEAFLDNLECEIPTERDTYAHMEHMMDTMLLRLEHDHEVIDSMEDEHEAPEK